MRIALTGNPNSGKTTMYNALTGRNEKVGLSGKSVIPFVITVGCAVPGIMASRTIRTERERRATAMLAPFIPRLALPLSVL